MKGAIVALVAILWLIAVPPASTQEGVYLQWITLSDPATLPETDDGTSDAINIASPGFPFWDSVQTQVYVGTNGLISFGSAYNFWLNQQFPGSGAINFRYLVAPFWDDVDIRGGNGEISYQVFQFGPELEQVNIFLQGQTDYTSFQGTWMMVAFWDGVHPYLGTSNPVENTFQAVLITDGVNSFTVFTYNCGLTEWDNGVTVGFSAAGQVYDNQDPSGMDLACINGNASVWSNVIYNLSMVPSDFMEMDQETYLDFIDIASPDNTLDNCNDCSKRIDFPNDFAFGQYYHGQAYINDNGVISMRTEFPYSDPSEFPAIDADIYWRHAVAPFWSNADLQVEGSVAWKTYNSTDPQTLNVGRFVEGNQNDAGYRGTWMLVAHWDSVHPYPHGDDSSALYNQKTNSFQAILITNGNKSYAVFTYKCSTMEWAIRPTIGTNAGGSQYYNHPLTGENYAFNIGCVHGNNSDINNVVYDLVPNPDDLMPTGAVPPYHTTIGSCAAANYTECCTSGSCLGEPQSCYCDALCRVDGTCCYDQQDICPLDLLTDNYLIVAERRSIDHIAYNGSGFEQLRILFNADAVGIDFHYERNYMFWSDVNADAIYRAAIDGTGGLYTIADSYLSAVDDIAVDWIANNVYWVDSIWSRIEVADMDGMYRTELLRTGPNTNPRGIAVDPQTRFMFWTDWGMTPKIERADMDGANRMTIVSNNLLQPNGITIDYDDLKIYWCDSGFEVIEYASLDGGGRTVLIQDADGLQGVFSLTVASSLVFWTDTETEAVYAAHKIDGNGDNMGNSTVIYNSFQYTPTGIEAVSLSRQGSVVNPCMTSGCAEVCVLSTNSMGYTCLATNSTPPIAPDTGSCADAGYGECCTHGYCAGLPPTCSCDDGCYDRGDCCMDTSVTCIAVPPLTPTQVTISNVTDTSAIISWTVPQILYTPEEYYVQYGLDNSTLDQTSASLFSGPDTEIVDQMYSIVLQDLHPDYAYFIAVTAENSISPISTDIVMFRTLEAAPSGPPQNFLLTVSDNTVLTLSWDPPADDMQNGVIISYTLNCMTDDGINLDFIVNSPQNITLGVFTPLLTYTCSIFAATAIGSGPSATSSVTVPERVGTAVYFPFIPLQYLDSPNTTQLAESDDGTSDSIPLAPSGVPFGSSNQTSAFVGTNGVLSFGTAYNSFANQQFAANDFRYLVAPFWDDVDIRGGNGEIYYWISDSGPFLDQVNEFIRIRRPTNFEATWMMVAYWVGVHPYFGIFNPEENTFQAIIATDGESTYAIFTYNCGLMEWDRGATIGFSAAGNPFINNDPSTSDVACANSPDSDWSNIVYLLSENNPELPPPSNITISDITNASVTVNWVVPFIEEQQQYTIVYGLSADSLNLTGGTQQSMGPDPNQMYSIVVDGLEQATTYYIQVVSTFGIYTLYSDITVFTTMEQAPTGPPRNFTGTAQGLSITLTWAPPAGDFLIDSYILSCDVDNGAPSTVIQLNPIESLTLDELTPSTTYTCSILATTSGGEGPQSQPIVLMTGDATPMDVYLPFIQLNAIYGVNQVFAAAADDGTTGPIQIEPGFPFGSSIQTLFYVGTNGLLSFDSAYNSFANQQFPGNILISSRYLVAPFWDDVDIRSNNGEISYEIHTSGYYLNEVNTFLQRKRPSDFVGTWMAVIYYDAVHPYFGAFNPEENTFQAILITDGTYSYTIFTYKCDLMEWDNGATIGYSAAGDPYENNDPSTSDVACLNIPDTNLTNVVFRLSESNPELELPSVIGVTNITLDSATVVFTIPRLVAQETYTVEYGIVSNDLSDVSMSMQSPDDISAVNQTYSITLRGLQSATVYYFRVSAVFGVVSRRFSDVSPFRTYENEQTYTLRFLPHDDSSINSGSLEPCDDCSSAEIMLPDDIPFGGYFHQSAYVSTNGLISFGRSFSGSEPEVFPPSSADIFWRYLVTPFWTDFNTTLGGSVSYEVYNSSSELLGNVSQLIQLEYGDVDFNGGWMLVAYWENIYSPFDPSRNMTNTFQAILVTNGSKSYAVYTYHCGDLYWLDPATIGFNAPPSYSYNHPLTGTDLYPDTIACVHLESEWNNVIYDLEPSPLILPVTPEPSSSVGSCRAAGYSTCCSTFFCSGSPPDCFCDTFCRFIGDCCYDFEAICPDPSATDDAYDLLVANGNYIYKVHFEGNDSEVLRYNESEQSTGVDFHFGRSKIFWSDVTAGIIYRADMDGTGVEVIASEDVLIVDDIAVDWVSDKLYWVDAVFARIEAMDLNTLIRTVILRTGPNTNPRAIVVEPINRFMFWTDWGQEAMIERSFMDGHDRRTIVSTSLSQPNGITIDYLAERIYWTDSDLDKIEYANYDGTGRTSVETEATGLLYPFAVTVADDILFWSDWASGSIYATHKDHGANGDQGYFNEIVHFPASTPYGIEALVSDRQPSANNSCEVNNCTHVCLMTGETEQGYTCGCPEGYGLESDGFECKVIEGSGSGESPPPEGSCIDGGYNVTCCEYGYCAGLPTTCFCDLFCYDRGDCCSDIDQICDRVRPVVPTDISAISTSGSTAVIVWTVPYIEFNSEVYTVMYGVSPDALDSTSNQIPSYSDITLTNQTYSVSLNDLSPLTTYYYQIRSENSELSSTSEVLQFTTPEGPPSGPPLNFDVFVEVTSLTFSWEPPAEEERNGVIVSYSLVCMSGGEAVIDLTLNPTVFYLIIDLYQLSTDYSCTVAASTAAGIGPSATVIVSTDDTFLPVIVHPFIPPGVTPDQITTYLPESDDGTSDAIIPAINFPFGSSNRTAIYVGTNGLLSFDTAYNSWFNQLFPGSSSINTRYLVAPFWDDVDIRGGNGQVFYEVHQSGIFLNQVNSYLRAVKPSTFEGTWMLVAYWDEVHPFFGASNPEENTFQAILITDGTYTYTVFTYRCGLLEWGNNPTIGYNAADDGFDNYDTSSVLIACLNTPMFSNWSNVVYRLSIDNPEFPPPEQVVVSSITLNSAEVTWTVPSLTEEQTYYVRYGTSQDALTLASDTVMSSTTLPDEMYSVTLAGLDDATVYYLQVVAAFSDITLYSTLESFRTLEAPPSGPPLNFSVSVVGVSLTFSWDEPADDRLIQSYTLACSVEGETAFLIVLQPILEIAIEELVPSTTYTCTIFASTSGGDGPVSNAITATTASRTSQDLYLPFLPLGVTYGVDQTFLPESDDGTEGPIDIGPGFPFGGSLQTTFFVGTNGLLSFGSAYNSFSNQQFPISSLYLVAPFWDDVDIRSANGIISYEIHDSGYLLDLVNNFLQRTRPSSFVGTWMAVVYWDAVHPYFGLSNPEENTFQAILITDGNYTYTIFIYKCGLLEWDNGVTIGFNAAGDPYVNNLPSSSEIACLNSANSNFTNVIYLLSNESPEIPIPQDVTYSSVMLTTASVSWRIPSFLVQEQYYVEYGTDRNNLDQRTDPISSPTDTSVVNMTYQTILSGLETATIYYFRVSAVFDEVYIRSSEIAALRTKEDEQVIYVPFLEPTDTNIDSGVLEPCDDCTSTEIVLPADFPFGGYFHQTAYVSSNGLISFGRPVTSSSPVPFPADTTDIFWSYIAAPFWSDINTTMSGSVSWEIHRRPESISLMTQVTNLVRSVYIDEPFSGTWMIVATWQDVVSPSMTMGNTFQAILITDGLKSFAVFTYRCGALDWSSPATIGINAPPDYSYIDPLTGSIVPPDEIACVHLVSVWNNIVIDLEPNPIILPVTPEPSNFIGSCAAAGYTDCCVGDFITEFCFSTDCYCDSSCLFFGDCCYDFTDICQDPTSLDYDLLIANGDHIFSVHYEGADSEILRGNTSQTVQGVDFHYNDSKIFWSHVEGFSSSIHQTSLESGSEIVLIDTNLLVVADIAVDWIANNLYWVDSAWARIEVLDLDTMYRAEILLTGANTNPTAIAVDSVSRLMFWTDFGITAQVESSFLDGSERRVLHNTELLQPVGITIDYLAQRIYWSDVGTDRIEFSNFDGSGRSIVESEATALYHPFALTVADDLLFWTDWETNSAYATHKQHGSDDTLGFFTTIASFSSTPYGIEAVLESRQLQVNNSCEAANCSHICLLTGVNVQGFTCACPEGYRLEPDGLFCKILDGSGATPPSIGSCGLAGYSSCCTNGYCAGSPATCFCHPDCVALGSCCSDFDIICQAVPPVQPTDVVAVNLNRTSADVSWVVPRFVYGTETYVVQYGLDANSLNQETDTVFSGLDTSRMDQTYLVSLEGLQPLTRYYFRVVATNILNNTSTDVSTFMTLNIGPPTNFDVMVVGTESLTFSWGAPFDADNLGIMSYTLICNPTFQNEIMIVVPTVGTITLHDFIPGTTYTCLVYASNTLGNGDSAVQTVTTLEGETYLPFLVLGNTPGVERVYLPAEDDAASGPIDLVGGLPTQDAVHTSAYVSTNGIITLDQRLLFWDAAQFPTSDYYIINSYMFAPFWSDIDIGRTGSVSYEVYHRGLSDSEDAILDRVSGFIASQLSSNFSGYWMMVAQWDSVHPFPHGSGAGGISDDYMEYLESENTFQAVIITNGVMSYSLYTYNCDLMSWSGYNTYATIGYNLNGDYRNHFLSGLTSAKDVACLSISTSKWNNLLYAIDPNGVSSAQTQRSACITQVIEDQDIFGDVDDIVNNLESCPCSLGQAQVDPRFAIYFSNSSDGFDCYVQLIPYGTSAQSCCYSTVDPAIGALLTTSPNKASMLLFSPFLYENETLIFDDSLREVCCGEAGFCEFYFGRRPADDCRYYEPLTWAWGFGDPHFRNLDGTTFTFNGQGEYTMAKVAESGFVLQGRTEPVSSDQNQATQFTAFAFGLPSEVIVIEVRVERGRMIVFLNQEDVTNSLLNNKIITDKMAIVLVDEYNVITSFSINGYTHSVSVTLDSSVNYLSYALNLANSMGTVTGLLGTPNGDTSDDFVYPDGTTTLPPGASDQMIHNWGQAWQITTAESLFDYAPDRSTEYYSNPDFTPAYKSDVVPIAADMISTYCGANAECIFDYSVTGNQAIAGSTLMTSQNYAAQEAQASNSPPTIYGMDVFQVTTGMSSVYNFTVDGGQVEVLGGLPANSMLVEDGDISGLYYFTWTLSDPTDTPISFIATNSMGGIAVFSPSIQICACANGGICSLDGFLGTQNNIFTLQCDCPDAWSGRYCEDDRNGCSETNCFDGVQCFDVPTPDSGAECGACPSGFSPISQKCADIDECSRQDTNNCQQSCTNTYGGYECTCSDGYELEAEDPTSCIDVDECATSTDNCQQVCTNTQGSYFCSCRPGFNIDSDGMTCNAQSGTECPAQNPCSDICSLVGGTPVCSCSRGYELGSDSATCVDINECTEIIPCEQNCANTMGSFTCTCGNGFTLGDDGRSCNDVDECVESAQSGSSLCPVGQNCQNIIGSYTCGCPDGTMLTPQNECEPIPVVEPTKVVVLPSSSSTSPPVVTPTPPDVGTNTLLVTLSGYTTVTFTTDVQMMFKQLVAEIITDCCATNPDQCQIVKLKRETVDIKAGNVIITDISNTTDGNLKFTLYVTTNDDGSNILKPESIKACLEGGDDKLKAAGFSITLEITVTTGKRSSGSGGLSGGAVAGIVIVVIFVVVAVVSVAAFILFRLRRRGKYQVSSFLPERLQSMDADDKKDLSALVMSTEEEGEL